MRGMAREMAWVQLFCRGSDCGVRFYICGSCYRGQVYCGERCRRRMRRRQTRLANRKHQDSPEGKLDHRDRQRVYPRIGVLILIGGMLALITEAQFEPRTVKVARVIDGDTIQVLSDGRQYTVRLIGADRRPAPTPRRRSKAAQCS